MMDPLEHLQMLKDSAAGIAPRKGDLKRIRALRFFFETYPEELAALDSF